MKQKYYFVITSIVQIIVSLLMIIFNNKIVKSIIDNYQEYLKDDNSEIWQSSIELYENYGDIIIIGLSVLAIIFAIIVLLYLFKKENCFPYKLVSIFAIILILTSESIIISTIAFINLFVCASKTKVKESPKEIKEEEPEFLPKRKFSNKDWILAILAILNFVLLPEFIKYLPLSFVSLNLILDILLFVLYFFLFKEELMCAFDNLKSNLKKYVKYVFSKQVMMFVIYIIVSLIVMWIKGNDDASVNQQIVESLPLWYVIPTSCLYAPFVEELLFRGALRRFIKNDRLFIFISGYSFGLLHTLAEATILNVFLMALPYAVLGGFFAYLYAKTGNITSSMMGHFFHNSFACILTILS